jgi:glycosyltransferase involved in cell wall biosynthesis
MTERPSLLCLSTYFPWPADAGGSIRVDGLLRALADGYDVRVLVPQVHDASTMSTILSEVEADLGITVETYAGPLTTRGRAAAAQLWLRSIAVRIPPWIYGDLDRDLVKRFSELVSQVDGVVLLEDFMGIYPLMASTSGQVPIVADKHVVLARPRSDEDVGGGGTAPLRARFQRRLTMSFERRYLEKVTSIVVTTPEDGRWLHELYGREPSAVIPTGIDLEPPRPKRAGPGRQVGWLSALDVEDNLVGLKRFVSFGWPALAALGYELSVAGRNPAPSVSYLDAVEGVRLVGQVESVPAFLADIDVAVVPLWSGRGIKVKTLTLMAAGLPVAATPMALEGMDVEDGRHCLIGRTPEELAKHVRSLLEDPELADSVAAAGRDFVASKFTWDAVGPQFVAVVQRALQASR